MISVLVWLGTMFESYLLGSIDTGIIVSRHLFGDDVRGHGSGAVDVGGEAGGAFDGPVVQAASIRAASSAAPVAGDRRNDIGKS